MTGDDVRELRAVAHPVRLRMLSLLTGSAMSAAEVARELGLTHANASYHLRILLESGTVVEAGEERIRGGVAKRYRYPHEDRSRRRSPATTESRIAEVRALGRELERRMMQRKRSGPSHLSDLDGWVEPEVWERVRELLGEASALMHDNNKPPRTPGTVHVSATSWTFEMTKKERS
ncbi:MULTISPECIES: helix-turn-helix domain-containing protein [unclassified Kribbella]|uniref:ArsR/SmtB family transcription factor n=1 Tax=unclassified Kribbella TaxID=2644121 RepID=UPI0033D4AC12